MSEELPGASSVVYSLPMQTVPPFPLGTSDVPPPPAPFVSAGRSDLVEHLAMLHELGPPRSLTEAELERVTGVVPDVAPFLQPTCAFEPLPTIEEFVRENYTESSSSDGPCHAAGQLPKIDEIVGSSLDERIAYFKSLFDRAFDSG